MQDKEKVLAVNTAFYAAFEALDSDAMASIWANGPGDVCVHPGWDILVGGSDIQEAWAVIFDNTGYMRFRPSDVRVMISGDMATVNCIENIFSVIEGLTIHSRVACTNVFRQCPDHEGEWRMVLHHASPIAQAQTIIEAEQEGENLH